MRIAFSGSHRVGKTTLVEHVADALPTYTTVDEPYALLEEEGDAFAAEPSIDDFEAQLERSLIALEEGEPNVLFDRCPADVLAYLRAHEDSGSFDADAWLERARAAMRTLDAVVFVVVEEPDRIALPSHEDAAYRRRVHEELEAVLDDDALGSEVEVWRVEGPLRARVELVLARIAELSRS